jgi:hypothetical protein
MAENRIQTIYWLDRDNRITKVSSTWDSFAEENEGQGAVSTEVVGKSIWDFVIGDLTRMWFDMLLKLCRLQNFPVERPYRCDTPSLRRYMSMTIHPEQAGALRVEHTVLSTEERETQVFCETAMHNHSALCMRCSICGRVKAGREWAEADSRKPSGDEPQKHYLTVAYTVCQDCQQLMPMGMEQSA